MTYGKEKIIDFCSFCKDEYLLSAFFSCSWRKFEIVHVKNTYFTWRSWSESLYEYTSEPFKGVKTLSCLKIKFKYMVSKVEFNYYCLNFLDIYKCELEKSPIDVMTSHDTSIANGAHIK